MKHKSGFSREQQRKIELMDARAHALELRLGGDPNLHRAKGKRLDALSSWPTGPSLEVVEHLDRISDPIGYVVHGPLKWQKVGDRLWRLTKAK